MTKHYFFTLGMLLFAAHSTYCQEVLIYDQQSSDESRVLEGEMPIHFGQPMGQSFTPSLSSVGFIQLHLADGERGNGIGATLYVNLRSEGISGPIIDSTLPIMFSDRFTENALFKFTRAVSVTPGIVYYLQPVVVDGDPVWAASAFTYNYPGGTAFFRGAPLETSDLWFREGIVVPEPGTVVLLLAGLGGIFYLRRMRP